MKCVLGPGERRVRLSPQSFEGAGVKAGVWVRVLIPVVSLQPCDLALAVLPGGGVFICGGTDRSPWAGKGLRWCV